MKLYHVLFSVVVLGLFAGLMAVWPKSEAGRIIAEQGHIRQQVELFYDRYAAWPGDFSGASAIWGVAGGKDGRDAACYEVDSRTLDDPRRTCDGDGNGKVFHKDITPKQTAPEWFRAWQHLTNAGLWQGQFSGKYDRFPRGAMPGVNVPPSAVIDGAGYTLMRFPTFDHPKWFNGDYWGVAFGSPFINPLALPVETRGPAVSLALAAAIDRKMDDGLPATGRVRSFRDLRQCIGYDEAQQQWDYLHEADTSPRCGLFLAFDEPGEENSD